jgi:ADP-heptose:LPS heptosyltransferase
MTAIDRVAAAHALIDAGWGLKFAGDNAGATEAFLKAVEFAPSLPRAHLAYGEALLAHGELMLGWREFAWRKKLNPKTQETAEQIALPEWTGQKMPSGRIFVACDEGIGDAIMFARYLPHIAERVAQVAVGWGWDFPELFQGITGVSEVYTSPPTPGEFDTYVFICDLPRVFETSLETIPVAIPYMPLDEEKVRQWKARLAAKSPGGQPRVGITWAGNPLNVRDAQRTLAFEQLRPLLEVEGINFVSLQKIVPQTDEAALAAATNVLDVSAELYTFADTAAVIANLDCVVTVDTAVAHLAGALGAGVVLLLPKPSDWRWLLDRTDTPWYPTMRLIRQQHSGDWAPVLSQAQDWLRQLI